jgi:Na+/proline symporter
MEPLSHIALYILLGAALPFVTSTLSIFSSKTRVETVRGYFLSDRQLSVDNYLKSTIGYSLQVASISLFFYWTFTFGILGPSLVAGMWMVGYWLLAHAIEVGRLDHFLAHSSATIHGFVGAAMTSPKSHTAVFAVLVLSLASVVGLGGTMMAEVDYSTQFFATAVGMNSIGPAVRVLIELTIVALIAVYVLWGGYKASVFTDRFQVPFAYVAFSVFGFGAMILIASNQAGFGGSIVICSMLALFALLLWSRRRLLRREAPGNIWDRTTATLTFGPILLLAFCTLVALHQLEGQWSFAALRSIIFPGNSDFLGFGWWGAAALVFVNGIWQFIDVSSLQRLQSIDFDDSDSVAAKRRLARIVRATGFEAGVGWLLIILTAVMLKSVGLSNDLLLQSLLKNNQSALLVAVFIFTVSVYMHSTVACFISALSYISFYDIVPIMGPRWRLLPQDRQLNLARITTAAVLIIVSACYFSLRILIPDEEIAAVLYGIYAFQIVSLPGVAVALFVPRMPVLPSAVIASVISGMLVALGTAIFPNGWTYLTIAGLDAASWTVIPPFASALVSTVVYVTVAAVVRRQFPLNKLSE